MSSEWRVDTQQQPNTLGNVSLWLGIASATFVFGIGLCALLGLRQRWIEVAATPLFVCGATSAFLGVIGFVTGVSGLLSSDRSKAPAAIGTILSVVGVCLFLAVLAQFRR